MTVAAHTLAHYAEVLTCVRSVNRTDSLTLLSGCGSVAGIMSASRETLAQCPGLGDKKVGRLWDALHTRLPGAGERVAGGAVLRTAPAAAVAVPGNGEVAGEAAAADAMEVVEVDVDVDMTQVGGARALSQLRHVAGTGIVELGDGDASAESAAPAAAVDAGGLKA